MHVCLPILRLASAGLAVALLGAPLSTVSAQASDGSAASAIGGGALGAYSGTVLGLAGAMGPCNRLLSGPVCPRVAAVVGGSLGLAAGAVMGGKKPDQVSYRLRNAGYGALAGGLVGLGLSTVIRQYAWPDPLAFAAVGAAIGTVPEASGVGFVAGAGVGVVSWLVFSRLSVGDAIALTAVGTAVGGFVGWAVKAWGSGSGPSTAPAVTFTIPFSIPVP